MFLRGLVLVALCFAFGSGVAFSQDYPSKPITLILPVAAGGANDTFARAYGPEMEKRLGQPMIIDNRPGAGGIVGLEALAKAKQDGYTLLLGHITSTFLTPIYSPDKLSFNADEKLVPLTFLISFPTAVVVQKSVPVNSFQELVAYAKANPGKLRFSTGGDGSQAYWDLKRFELHDGLQFIAVPTASGAEANQLFVNGDLHVGFHSLGSARPLLESGDLKLLAISGSKERLQEFPDTPTLDELGYEGVGSALWIGLYGFGDFPKEAADKLVAATHEVLAGMAPALQKTSINVSPNTPEEFSAWLRQEKKAFEDMRAKIGAK
jgi:tripartite-type tricarboxylate transporter receptor subunit TctC